MAPPNDLRVDAEELTGTSGTASGTTVGCDAGTDIGLGSAYYGAATVWYYWAALDAGDLELTLTPADPVYVEAALFAQDHDVASDSGDALGYVYSDDATPQAVTVAHPGGELTLVVASYGGDESDFDVAWSLSAPADPVGPASPVVVTTATDVEVTVATSEGAGPAGPIVVDAPSSVVVRIPPSGRRWRVAVTDAFGTVLGEVPYARIKPITYDGNLPESWELELRQNDPAVALFTAEHYREVQLWRGNQILAWGPAVRWTLKRDTFTVSLKGAAWHLTRRFIGHARRHNYVDNGSFERGDTAWSYKTSEIAVAYSWEGAQADPPEHEVVSSPTLTGLRALRLRNSVPGADAFAFQAFPFAVDDAESPDGETWTLRGYALVTAPIPADALAFEGRGLYLERFSSTQLDPRDFVQAVMPGAPLSIQHTFEPLDESTPVGVWTRFEVEFNSPPKAGEWEGINVRLYAPAGIDVYWDGIALTLIEKLAFYGVDQALIAAGIVEHLQDSAYDKSDVNITPAPSLTGIRRTRVYKHQEHPPGYGALEEFTKLGDGLDYSMVYSATDRYFVTHYPRRGDYKPQWTLTLPTAGDAESFVRDWSLTFDGEKGVSSVVTLGTGDGSSREEGSAIDTSGLSGGLTLEDVFVAPPETPIDSLDAMAEEALDVGRLPYILEVTIGPVPPGDPDPVGNLWPGDTVPVDFARHALNLSGVWRVARAVVTPLEGGAASMVVTLNQRGDTDG